MSDEPKETGPTPENDPNLDPNGVHPSTAAGDVPHYHFNILKLVRDAKAAFEAANPGKVAAFFYAPEAVLYLIDRSVKSSAFAGGTDPSVLSRAVVTNVFGLELVSVPGTCVTVTAEALHDEEEEKEVTGIPVPAPSSSLLN